MIAEILDRNRTSERSGKERRKQDLVVGPESSMDAMFESIENEKRLAPLTLSF